MLFDLFERFNSRYRKKWESGIKPHQFTDHSVVSSKSGDLFITSLF